MTGDAQISDPAANDPSLSPQVGDGAFCAGPVIFPMAEGADADRWAQEFGYPLESQTGQISVGGLMDELRASDEAGRFMLGVYDEIVRQKGGEGSEQAAAFLSNFMPPMPGSGDKRRHYFRLIFADEVRSSLMTSSFFGTPSASSRTRAIIDGAQVESVDDMFNLLGSEILIFSAPRTTTTASNGFYSYPNSQVLTPAAAASRIISDVERNNAMKPWIDWMIFGANVLLVFAGVGVTVGALRIAATTGARLLASTALAFEVADGTEYITGFVGGKGAGYNPLKAAFKAVGSTAAGGSGVQAAEHVYNTLNIAIGFGGRAGLVAGSIYGTAMMPARCQPVEGGTIDEQKLQSQGAAQRTVF